MDNKSQVSEKIDERVLRLLGLTDVFDLDYGTYWTLLREKLVEVDIGKKIPSEEVMLLQSELKRVRGKKGRFKIKKNKIRADKVTNVGSTNVGSTNVAKKNAIVLTGKVSLIPRPTQTEPKEDKKNPSKKDDVKSTVDSIYTILSNIFKFDKKVSDREKRDEENKKRGQRESKLEGGFKGGIKVITKVAKKLLSPFQAFFDRIIRFLVFTFLGRVFTKFMNWIGDKKNQKKLEALGRFLKAFWPAISTAALLFLTPFGGFVRGTIGFLLGSIPKIFGLVTRIRKFGLKDLFKGGLGGIFGGGCGCGGLPGMPGRPGRPGRGGRGGGGASRVTSSAQRPTSPGRGSAMVTASEFGGIVNRYDDGGKVTGSSGIPITGAGRDNKLVPATTGDVILTPEDQKDISSKIGGDINTVIKGPNKENKKTGNQMIAVRPGERKLTQDDQQKLYEKTGFNAAEYVGNRKPKLVSSSNIKMPGQMQAASLGGIVQGFTDGGIVGGVSTPVAQTSTTTSTSSPTPTPTSSPTPTPTTTSTPRADAKDPRNDTRSTAPSSGTTRITPDTASRTQTPDKDNKGNAAILVAAKKAVTDGKRGPATPPCASWVRMVLGMAGHPSAEKTTQKGDLDPEHKAWGRNFAASFAGTDMGEVVNSQGGLQGGDIVLQKNTYGSFPDGAITHVSISSDKPGKILHQSTSGGAPKESGLFNFSKGVRLPGSGVTGGTDGAAAAGGASGGASGGGGGGATNKRDEVMMALGLGKLLGLSGGTSGDKPAGAATTDGGTTGTAGGISGAGIDKGASVAKKLMVDLKIKAPAAAGIVGNLMHESGLKPDNVEDGKGFNDGPINNIPPGTRRVGYGWGQWTDDRLETLRAFFKSRKVDTKPATDDDNYAYLVKELTSSEPIKGHWKGWNGKNIPEDNARKAATWFMMNWERPGSPHEDARQDYADKIFKKLSETQSAQPTPQQTGTSKDKNDRGEHKDGKGDGTAKPQPGDSKGGDTKPSDAGALHPSLVKMSDKNIKKASSPPGYCVTGSLNTMQKSGVRNPDGTGNDNGNNPRGAIVQLVKSFGWGSIGGSNTTLKSPYGNVNVGVFSKDDYAKAVDSGKVPSGALIFQTRHPSWNGTSAGSHGYDFAIAQKQGRALWNGQPMGQWVYGNTTQVVALTPGGKAADGSPPSGSSGDAGSGGGGDTPEQTAPPKEPSSRDKVMKALGLGKLMGIDSSSGTSPPGSDSKDSGTSGGSADISLGSTEYKSLMIETMNKGGIKDKNERTMFMAQVGHESGEGKYMEEIASGAAYEGRRDLGNTQPGDGKRYKGRGYIQITGRTNYRTYGPKAGVPDAEENPTKLAEPKNAAKVALAYWLARVNRSAAAKGLDGMNTVTRNINGGLNGLDDRIAKYKKYEKDSSIQKMIGGGDINFGIPPMLSVSKELTAWAKANRKMIEKTGTKQQKEILAKVDMQEKIQGSFKNNKGLLDITSNLGFNYGHSAADNRLIDVGGNKIAAQPGEQLFSYMIPKQAVEKGAGSMISNYANKVVAQLDANSSASKQLGMRSKTDPSIKPYPTTSTSSSSSPGTVVLPPIYQSPGSNRVISQGTTREVMFSPVCPAGAEERKRILNTLGVIM